jgi:hypothetical protein
MGNLLIDYVSNDVCNIHYQSTHVIFIYSLRFVIVENIFIISFSIRPQVYSRFKRDLLYYSSYITNANLMRDRTRS